MNQLLMATLILNAEKIIKVVTRTFLIGVGLTAGYITIRNFVNKKKQSSTVDEYKKKINKKNLSYTEAQFSAFADGLYSALQGFSEKEDYVAEIILKMRTKDDWAKLIEAFGVRDLSPKIIFLPKKEYNLITALNEYVKNDKENWKKITNHLAKIGIYL